MEPPLIVDKNDSKWKLLEQVLKIFDSSTAQQIIGRNGIRVAGAIPIFKIAAIAVFFSCEVSYVAAEMKTRRRLKKFAGIEKVPDVDCVYRFLSRLSVEQFTGIVLQILNRVCGKRSAGKATVIADCTDIGLDLNWFRKTITKADI